MHQISREFNGRTPEIASEISGKKSIPTGEYLTIYAA
jgi:hypothetical protein